MRKFNKDTIETIKQKGYKIIYGDTDSIAFLIGNKKESEVKSLLEEFLPNKKNLIEAVKPQPSHDTLTNTGDEATYQAMLAGVPGKLDKKDPKFEMEMGYSGKEGFAKVATAFRLIAKIEK
ncbi:MAG: hypothetical protein MUE91_13865, partial [Ignavibacteriaceae bacterium]|nr:hypothetical protein [Ignavibacteriaceae bacterium]